MLLTPVVRRSFLAIAVSVGCIVASVSAVAAPTLAGDIKVQRTNNHSPDFVVSEEDIEFFMNYTGWTKDNAQPNGGKRFFHDQIGAKVLRMIAQAQKHITMSVFLFDSLYAEGEAPIDIVGAITQAFITKKRSHPNIAITLILDPSHKTYGQRVSRSEHLLRANGIDVFYSDMLSGLKKASLLGTREVMGHLGRAIDGATFNTWNSLWSAVFSRAKIPVKVDGEYVSLEGAYNAVLLKANHRKILVADTPDGSLEALITSANPHNASVYHVNTALSVKGATAAYVYNVLREDIALSTKLGKNFAHWHDAANHDYKRSFLSQKLPEIHLAASANKDPKHPDTITATFVTEEAIRDTVLDALHNIELGDTVRIQMFYLSFAPVVDAILEASTRSGVPVRLLLDANKDSFNKEKDGTPNRQVARYLLRNAKLRGGQIEVRWYSTHGEQNHAKIMSITNPLTGKFFLTTGSGNWTGRNLDGVNMESNLIINGSQTITARFNNWFDLFWTNKDGNEYSVDYSVFQDHTGSDQKWKRGEKPYYLGTF